MTVPPLVYICERNLGVNTFLSVLWNCGKCTIDNKQCSLQYCRGSEADLFSKVHEDLSSSPQNPYKKMDMVAHTCNPNSGTVDTGTSLELASHLRLFGRLQACERTYTPPQPPKGRRHLRNDTYPPNAGVHMDTGTQGEMSQVIPFACVLVICKCCVLVSVILHRSAFVCADTQLSYCLENECLSPLSPNKEISMD